MKLNKLLLAASIAALTATSASALELTVVTPTTTVAPALELEFPQPAGNVAALNFTLSPSTVGGEFPAGNNIAVGITLPLGTSFASPVEAGDVTGNGTGAVATIVQRAGQTDNGSVELLISLPQNDTTTELTFDFDVKLDECPAAQGPLTVSAATEGGIPIENGTVTSSSFVSACRPAVSAVVFDDNALFGATPGDPTATPPVPAFPGAPLNADTIIELPDYTSLSDNIVGYVNGTIDGTVARDINGTPVDSSDIASVRLNVTLEDTTGLEEITLLGQTKPIVPGQLSYRFTFDNTQKDNFFDGTPDPIRLFENGTDRIATQQLSVDRIFATFVDTNANFVPTKFLGAGDIDFLQRDGQTFGVFDWNGGPLGGTTNSVYRVTGLSQTEDTPYTITFVNARPATAEGTYRGVVPAALATAQNGEAVLTSIGKWGIPAIPDFIRADVLVNFEASDAIDVDRLLARNGVISDFGGGANGDFFGNSENPSFDADNVNGTE